MPSSFPWRSWSAASSAAFAACSPAIDRQPLADVLERERVVADDLAVVVHEPLRRLGRLVVAVDRRRLAVARDAVVRQRDVDDVRVVRRLARDDERLRQLQPDDPCLDLHLASLAGRREIETT